MAIFTLFFEFVQVAGLFSAGVVGIYSLIFRNRKVRKAFILEDNFASLSLKYRPPDRFCPDRRRLGGNENHFRRDIVEFSILYTIYYTIHIHLYTSIFTYLHITSCPVTSGLSGWLFLSMLTTLAKPSNSLPPGPRAESIGIVCGCLGL